MALTSEPRSKGSAPPSRKKRNPLRLKRERAIIEGELESPRASQTRTNTTRMFDISFSELVLVCVIALLVLGPERMPKALRTLGLWIGRFAHVHAMKTEIEREIGNDEIRRQLHNEAVIDQMKPRTGCAR